MKNDLLTEHGSRRGSSRHNTGESLSFILAFGLVVVCFVLLSRRPPIDAHAKADIKNVTKTVRASATIASGNRSANAAATTLKPQPIHLAQKVLLEKAWNSGPEALGRFTPTGEDGTKEGAVLGPTSVACVGNSIYVFDNNDPNKRRLAVYDANGALTSSLPLPGGLTWADLVVDPTDSSLFVVDHARNDIYKVRGDQIREIDRTSLRDFPLGMRFGYDEPSHTLYVRDRERQQDVPILINDQRATPNGHDTAALCPVWGDFDPENNKNLLLNFKNGSHLSVGFDNAVESVDEMTVDRLGRVWVMFTFGGDYRVRRLALVDPSQNAAGVELVDLEFPYENIRRMAPFGNGVVIVSGNEQKGFVRSFDYSEKL